MTPDLQYKIAIWREKAQNGTLSEDELKEAITILRAGRLAAAQASESAKKKKAIAVIPNSDDLLRELGL